MYLKSACHDKQKAARVLIFKDRQVVAIQSLKAEKLHEKDCLAIFKPGLWQTGFFRCGKECMVPFSAATNGE